MSEEFERSGLWWDPADPERQQRGGTIQYSKAGGVTLEIPGGSVEELDAAFGSDPAPRPLMVGFMSQGGCATLVECGTTGHGISMPGIITLGFRAYRGALLGSTVIEDPDVIDNFDVIAVRFEHLAEWSRRSSVVWQWRQAPDDSVVNVTTTDIPDLEADIPGAHVRLRVHHEFQGLNGPPAIVKEIHTLEVEATDKTTIEELQRRFVRPLHVLVTLGCDIPVAITDTFVSSSDVTDKDGKPVRFDYVRRGSLPDETEDLRRLHPLELLFTLGDTPGLEPLLQKWFAVFGELDSAIDLFFGSRIAPPTILESRFLNVSQAAEVYHRRRYKGLTAFPVAEFKARRTEIVDAAPKKFRTWLKQQLAWSNELRLKQRIEHLAMLVAPALSKILGPPKEFAAEVVDTRNYYTHWEKKSSKVAEGEDLYWLTEKLGFMIQGLLLLELGLDESTVTALFERNTRYQRTVAALSS